MFLRKFFLLLPLVIFSELVSQGTVNKKNIFLTHGNVGKGQYRISLREKKSYFFQSNPFGSVVYFDSALKNIVDEDTPKEYFYDIKEFDYLKRPDFQDFYNNNVEPFCDYNKQLILLHSLYVKKSCRGQGLSRLLLQDFKKKLQQNYDKDCCVYGTISPFDFLDVSEKKQRSKLLKSMVQSNKGKVLGDHFYLFIKNKKVSSCCGCL